MKGKGVEVAERRRPLVEINLIAGSKTRPSWPPRPKLSSAKRISASLRRVLGLH
jgi:hypothetical protein